MATKKRVIKKKAAAKKKAAKKAVKKAVAVVTKPKLTPLTRYADWGISRIGNVVSFGCGDVKVLKTDLRIVAEMKQSSGFKEFQLALARLSAASRRNSYSHERSEGDILRIPSETLLRIAGN